MGRFINADAFVSTGTDLLGYNMFVYCNNNPVNYVDPTGSIPAVLAAALEKIFSLFICGLVAGAIAGITTFIFTGSTEEAIQSFQDGFAVGVISGIHPALGTGLAIWGILETAEQLNNSGSHPMVSASIALLEAILAKFELDGSGLSTAFINALSDFSESLTVGAIFNGVIKANEYHQSQIYTQKSVCTTYVMHNAPTGGGGGGGRGRNNRTVCFF